MCVRVDEWTKNKRASVRDKYKNIEVKIKQTCTLSSVHTWKTYISTERNQIDDQISFNGHSKRYSIVIIVAVVLVFAIVVVDVIGIAQVIASLYQLPSIIFFPRSNDSIVRAILGLARATKTCKRFSSLCSSLSFGYGTVNIPCIRCISVHWCTNNFNEYFAHSNCYHCALNTFQSTQIYLSQNSRRQKHKHSHSAVDKSVHNSHHHHRARNVWWTKGKLWEREKRSKW